MVKMLRKYRLFLCIGIMCLFVFIYACSNASENVHKCSGAGFWFPRDPHTLAESVDRYMKEAPKAEIKGELVALVSPHAGYRFAGPVMGAAYFLLIGRLY